jgi:hypothetical protein
MLHLLVLLEEIMVVVVPAAGKLLMVELVLAAL